MWAAICKFFAAIFSSIFKDALETYREPTEVVSTGYDDEIEDDIDDGIDEELDFLSAEPHKVEKDQPDDTNLI